MTLPFEAIDLQAIPSHEDLIWLGGLLDGEGCFRSYLSHGIAYPLIGMTNTDRGLTAEAAQLLGVRLCGPVISKRGHQPMWQLKVYGKRAYEWTKLLLPYLRGPRKLAEMLELLEQHREKYGS